MDLLVSWLLFPFVLVALWLGVGLLVEALSGIRLPGSLLVGVGLAGAIVLGQFLTLADATAELATPVIVACAVAGLGLALTSGRAIRPPVALSVALAAVFAVYAAPIVASGDPTLAGFIKLDDTATWLTFTDHIMELGRDLSGLGGSTYQRTLEVNVGEGYPIGAFVPFGVGVQLFGVDAAWLIQPYMAVLALVFALSAWSLTGLVVASPWARAAVVAIASQPALLFGYYLWGGVKEIAAAALIATTAALTPFVFRHSEDPRALAALVLASGGVVGILSPGGLIWIMPILLGLAALLATRLRVLTVAGRAAGFAVGLALCAIPVLIPGGIKPPTSSPLSDDEAKGNLIEPLETFQVAGIWPAGDFRLSPDDRLVTDLLVALVLAVAVAGAVWAYQRRGWGVLALIGAGTLGCATLILIGSPWVEGKSMATASPMLLLVAMIGAVAVGHWIRPAAGIAVGVVIAGGVIWSNALGYRDVSLAPYEQFTELEEIGDEIAGEGPALMTEYSPFGARHFLREAEPESVSELRLRTIPLRSGRPVDKGLSADTDDLDPAALGVYRTLVLRRSPAQSRPPSPYELVWSGRFYQAWQRPEGSAALPERLPLGSRYNPVSVPRCADVRALAASGSDLVAATGVSSVVVSLADTDYPESWSVPGSEFAPRPTGSGSFTVDIRLNRPDEYEFWLGESIRPRAELFVDGEAIGTVRHELNNFGQYTALGTTALDPGIHQVELRLSGPDLGPGSGGVSDPVGPLVLSGTEAADSRLVEVKAAEAESLCGREWDWIEVAG